MKVKIGEITIDAEDQPVMIILSDRDKINIASMPPDKARYCGYPLDRYSEKEIEEFMKIDGETL